MPLWNHYKLISYTEGQIKAC